jgi:hypothetical protein
MFEWLGVKYGFENIHQGDMCLKEIKLCAQIMITILGLIISIIRGVYMTI